MTGPENTDITGSEMFMGTSMSFTSERIRFSKVARICSLGSAVAGATTQMSPGGVGGFIFENFLKEIDGNHKMLLE